MDVSQSESNWALSRGEFVQKLVEIPKKRLKSTTVIKMADCLKHGVLETFCASGQVP